VIGLFLRSVVDSYTYTKAKKRPEAPRRSDQAHVAGMIRVESSHRGMMGRWEKYSVD